MRKLEQAETTLPAVSRKILSSKSIHIRVKVENQVMKDILLSSYTSWHILSLYAVTAFIPKPKTNNFYLKRLKCLGRVKTSRMHD